jgi:alpha-glucosidase (family GH31 glycosyl hydrolase)
MTMALNATHPMSNYTQYDTHSLFGHMQAMTTYNAMFTANDSRLSAFADMSQFILSRSTFSGSGQYASHSTGDIMRTWEDMKYSVAGLMNFNMFGIPHTGADVCGSLSATLNDTES